jgi:hypothetical protein
MDDLLGSLVSCSKRWNHVARAELEQLEAEMSGQVKPPAKKVGQPSERLFVDMGQRRHRVQGSSSPKADSMDAISGEKSQGEEAGEDNPEPVGEEGGGEKTEAVVEGDGETPTGDGMEGQEVFAEVDGTEA